MERCKCFALLFIFTQAVVHKPRTAAFFVPIKKKQAIMEDRHEIYYVDYGAAKVYYRMDGDNAVCVQDRRVTMPREKFLDYLATARVLGHKTGKL